MKELWWSFMRINASFPSRNHSEPFSATLLSKKVSRHHQLWIALSFAFGQLKEKLNANQNAKWQVKWHGFNCILHLPLVPSWIPSHRHPAPKLRQSFVAIRKPSFSSLLKMTFSFYWLYSKLICLWDILNWFWYSERKIGPRLNQ